MKPFRVILLIAGAAALIISIRLLVKAGAGNNFILSACITSCLLVYAVFYDKFIRALPLNICILIIITACAGLAVFIAIYGTRDTAMYGEDAVIALGGGIKGERVSLSLKRRLDKTVEYHKKNPGAVIVVSGGQGPEEDISEALAMKRYLVLQGTPENIIILEDKSVSTFENIKFSKEILDGIFDGGYTALIITSDFHMFRASRFAEAAGLDFTRLNSGTPAYTLPVNYLRETAAVIKYWVIKK